MENIENKPKKLGLMTVLGYIVGIVLFMAGLGGMFLPNYGVVVGILYLLAGLAVFPPFWVFIRKRYNFEASRWLRIAVFLALISVSGGLVSRNSGVSMISNTTPTTVVSSSTASKPEEKKKEIPTYKIGDSVNMGGKTLTVNGTKPYTSDNPFMAPDSGNKYVAVDISLKNDSSEPFSYNALDFKLQDDKDYQYSHGAFDISPYLSYGALQPGQTTRGFIGYEIPVDNVPAKLIFTPGIFGLNQIIVELQ